MRTWPRLELCVDHMGHELVTVLLPHPPESQPHRKACVTAPSR